MLLQLKKSEKGFIPADDESVEIFNKLKLNDIIFTDYKPKRSYANHKRFFSMLKGVVDNSDHYKTVDNLLDVIKLKTGHFETVVSHKGEQLYIPKSISFSTMKEDEFKEFFSCAIDVVLEFTSNEDIDSILRYC